MTLPLATALDITATGIGAGIRCNKTPFLGGQGRNALLINNAAVGGSGVVKIQGNPSNSATAPASGDSGWTDIVSLTATSPLEQEIVLPNWIRVNVTTLGTGTVTIMLEGVQ
ncbi:hypothetical protein [Luteibacter sp. SG786]|uniref:hypothetical protein n=1 Tax=Luteibacter sp. SG786 TaxID=2587130 RepID=UPI00141DCFD0|nr:hypothetical protein [Luteibacter sp. SG786]NII54395.1 hypothetical protein [Luteibacter sp. SG786]